MPWLWLREAPSVGSWPASLRPPRTETDESAFASFADSFADSLQGPAGADVSTETHARAQVVAQTQAVINM
jgi:hypothetical protein